MMSSCLFPPQSHNVHCPPVNEVGYDLGVEEGLVMKLKYLMPEPSQWTVLGRTGQAIADWIPGAGISPTPDGLGP